MSTGSPSASSLDPSSKSPQQPQQSFVSNLIERSLSVSKTIYELTGISNEFLETQAAFVGSISLHLANIVDARIDSTSKRILSVKAAVASNTVSLLVAAQNHWVVQKSDDLSNQFLTLIEAQIAQFEQTIQTRFQSKKAAAIEGEENDNLVRNSLSRRSCSSLFVDKEEAIIDRVNGILKSLQSLGLLIADSAKQEVLSYRFAQLVCQNLNVVTENAVHACRYLESFAEVLYGTVLLAHIVNPLINQIKVQYANASNQVVIVIENVKQTEVKNVLNQAKSHYATLYAASVVAVKGNKLSIAFAKEFYTKNSAKIEENLAGLLKDITVFRERVAESAKNLYTLSIQEFRNKLAQKTKQKAIEESIQDETQSESAVY